MTVCELSNTASTCNNSFSVPLLQHNLAGSVGSVGISHNDATTPVPSSTLFPSSAGHTPPSTLPRTSTPPTCMTEEDLVECAREYAASNVKPVSGEWGVSSVPTTRALGIILGSVLSLPAAVKSDTSTPHSAQDSSRTSSVFCPDIYRRAKGQPYALNTQDAQTQFTRELDGLLRQVQLEQRRLKADFTSSVSRSHSQESSSSSRFSLSTSSSVYAADISLGHSTARSSASSFSASTHLSRSHSSTPSAVSGDNSASHSDHSDDSPEGLKFANTPMAARFVYGSISDETDGVEIDLAEAEPGIVEQQIQIGSEDVVEDLVRPSTPSPIHNLATPGAPKKNRAHLYFTNVNAASSRKRPRVMSIPDSPQQDRSPSGGYMRARPSSCTPGEAQTPPDSTVSPKARITGSDVSPKRARLSYDVSRSNSSGHTQVKLLAREPASFRRAASLRSEPSAKLLSIAELKKKPAVAAIICSKSASNASLEGNPDSGEYPPTQPVTPVNQSPHIPSSASGSPFPILSPSALGPMPTPRLMDAEVAESRLRILVRKELAARVSDGLLSAREDTGDSSIDPCATVDSDQEMWTALGETVSNGEIKASKVGIRQQQSEDQPATPSLTEVPLTLGIEEEFRVRVVEWILDVKPPSFPSKPSKCANLRAQLTESPNTRWHAAHLLTRYFLRLGPSPLSSPIPESTSDEKGHRVLHGREALTWDVAVGCISLAVKFHRDFLHPLYPALAGDYLILAPHTMEYEDLESAHRDILTAMDYCIESYTPGAYIEELLAALPSIRSFTDERGDWDFARTEAWEILFDSLVDIAYLRHHVHVITGCALVIGIVESIVYRKKTEAALKSKYSSGAASKRRRGLKCECEKSREKAVKAAFCIEQDIQDVLGVSETSWARCMTWLKAMDA